MSKMANEKRLIDANALTHEIIFVKKCLASEDKAGEWTKGYRSGLVATLAQIDETPTVDAVEVVHGDWRLGEFNSGRETVFAECSVCDAVFEVSSFTLGLNYNYCPNCGAKMDGGNDDG